MPFVTSINNNDNKNNPGSSEGVGGEESQSQIVVGKNGVAIVGR